MKKYLYGASIQGIQSFIFKTNKLKEIIGASELVEKICTTKFFELSELKRNSVDIIQSAAGNVKCILTEEQCRSIVLKFPMEAQKIAPGITVSQAVVAFNDGEAPPIDELERKLKIQRNIIAPPIEIGYMGLERDRRTGGVAFEEKVTRKSKEIISRETKAKIDAIFSDQEFKDDVSKEALFTKISALSNVSNRDLSFDIEDITRSGNNSWIAIIHADGNGLGKIIQNNGEALSRNKEFKLFSDKIEISTTIAVQKAFNEIILGERKKVGQEKYRFPIRPVILGGDDLTVIIRADLALDFTEVYLREFEAVTKKEFEGLKTNIPGLTACAGIAFVKNSYPLHYGLQLAEELCRDGKKVSREESSLAFYKVQESFVEDLEILKTRTLKTLSGLSYYGGPYNFAKLDNLKAKLEIIKKEAEENEKSKAIGKLRQIVSESYKNISSTLFMMERMKEINDVFYKNLQLDEEKLNIQNNGISQLVDLITLQSINYGN